MVPHNALRGRHIRHYLENIPGAKKGMGAVHLPLEPRVLELALSMCQNATLDPGAKSWYSKIRNREQEAVNLKHTLEPDARVTYPPDHPVYGKPLPVDTSPYTRPLDLLYPFQRVGVLFLHKVRRAMLCDELGMGKTATAIVATDIEAQSDARILVLCPNSLKVWWHNEIERWSTVTRPITIVNAQTRDLDLLEYKTRSGWFIMNWELLRLTVKDLKQWRWDWILADEAHRAKNRKTQLWRAFVRLRAEYLILITGTPFANDPSELWALCHLLYPDRFPSFWRFYEMYVDYSTHYLGFREVEGVRNAEILRNELRPIMLRRPKKKFLKELPDKTYKTIPVRLVPRQLKMYRQMVREMLVELEGGEELQAVNAISMITRLRQIVSTTHTLEDSDHSSKLDAIVDLVKDTDEKIVVFSQFRMTVWALAKRLAKAGISCVTVLGGMHPEDVAEAVRLFQEDTDPRVFVATAQTGGEGVTLTASSTVVFVDVHWNPAKQTQAEDRIHRIGQKNACLIVTLHCPRTVDDLVRGILQRKTRMIEEVLRGELVKHLRTFEEAY